jgi:hypothetical protein
MNKIKTKLSALVVVFIISIAFANEGLAQESPGYNRDYVEKLVFLNENGIISVSYNAPWFYEVADYAEALIGAMRVNLKGAGTECVSLQKSLINEPRTILNQESLHLLTSLENDRRTDPSRLMSSLLRKYTDKNPVDIERDGDSGDYQVLHGKACNLFGVDEVGVVQHMIVLEKGRHEHIAQQVCDWITSTAACLDDLTIIDQLNRIRLKGASGTAIGFGKNTVFDPINPPVRKPENSKTRKNSPAGQ